MDSSVFVNCGSDLCSVGAGSYPHWPLVHAEKMPLFQHLLSLLAASRNQLSCGTISSGTVSSKGFNFQQLGSDSGLTPANPHKGPNCARIVSSSGDERSSNGRSSQNQKDQWQRKRRLHCRRH